MSKLRDWMAAVIDYPKDSIPKTLGVAFLIALVAGFIVSTTTVLLEPRQLANRQKEEKKNLMAMVEQQSGLKRLIDQLGLPSVSVQYVDLETGKVLDGFKPGGFNHIEAAEDPNLSVPIPPHLDIAGLKRRAKVAPVYLIQNGNGIHMIVLPVYGKGYASTLKGYMGLENDANTIAGISFYDHEETPGVGARIDDARWLRSFVGKKIRDANGRIRLQLTRKAINPDSPEAVFSVDGITGATKTSNGVERLIRFWAGDFGYGRYLEQFYK